LYWNGTVGTNNLNFGCGVIGVRIVPGGLGGGRNGI
jgi:hypothetical protein